MLENLKVHKFQLVHNCRHWKWQSFKFSSKASPNLLAMISLVQFQMLVSKFCASAIIYPLTLNAWYPIKGHTF